MCSVPRFQRCQTCQFLVPALGHPLANMPHAGSSKLFTNFKMLMSGNIAISIVQLGVINANCRWLLGLRPRPHQGAHSSPLDPPSCLGRCKLQNMAWSPQKILVPEASSKSSSGSRGGCGTGFRTLRRGSTRRQSGGVRMLHLEDRKRAVVKVAAFPWARDVVLFVVQANL